ncbi:HAD family hydrolase [Gracilimonas sp. Q87]|uniref:HAD family hydrolase n=1 Tax=Gracilimonas sp. Q87 TaxID=3384766 RepID=UPI0039842B95
MQKIEAAIFDMDGVIVHSNPTHKRIINEFCQKYGLEVSDEELQKSIRANQSGLDSGCVR